MGCSTKKVFLSTVMKEKRGNLHENQDATLINPFSELISQKTDEDLNEKCF